MKKSKGKNDPVTTLGLNFLDYWNKVKPKDETAAFVIFESVKNAYFAGAGDMAYITHRLAMQKKPSNAKVLEDIYQEIEIYFKSQIETYKGD